MNRDAGDTHAGLTRRLLGSVSPALVQLAPTPSNLFAWPTENCQVRCRHCNFASRPDALAQRTAEEGEALAEWAHNAGTAQLVLCGGGEPLEEPHFCSGAFAEAARRGLRFAIYTSGNSPFGGASSTIAEWLEASGGLQPPKVWVRLSLDHFHVERIGIEPVVDWINVVLGQQPEWRVSLRMLRVIGDRSADEIALRLGAELQTRFMVLPGGRRLSIEERGVVLDGRATLGLLSASGLSLVPSDAALVEHWQQERPKSGRLGRVLSRRLTVGAGRVDLEIRGDNAVQVLESLPNDHRLDWRQSPWSEVRDSYYRDPFVHAVAVGGLDAVAELVDEMVRDGQVDRATIAHSVSSLTPGDAALVRARLVLDGPLASSYSRDTRRLARELVERVASQSG